MAQVHAFDFLVTGSGIQREIPLLLLFGVLLGREANPINIFLECKKKTQAKSMINNNKK
jgi:hypothetical protein